MNSTFKILLPAAVLLICSAIPASAQMPTAGSNMSRRISDVPGAGLSYPAAPSIVTPTQAAPGAEVPFSTQHPTVPANVSQGSTAGKDNTNGKPPKDTGTTAAVAPAPQPKAVVTTYDPWGEPYSIDYYKSHTRTMTIAMLRRPELKPEQFVLHLTGRDLISGCPKMSNMPTKVDFKEGAVEVTLDDYTIDLRHLTRAPEYGCHLRPHTPTADIILSRDDLVAKNIHQIKLKLGRYTDTYDIDMTAQRIRLAPSALSQRTPPMFQPAKMGNIAAPLTHWFYPEGTVILYVPAAKDRDVSAAIAEMAKKENLEPIQSEFPDFRSPLVTSRLYYYVDKKGILTKNHDIAGGVVAGTIPVTKTVYGLEKDEQMTENIQVFARLPNAYE